MMKLQYNYITTTLTLDIVTLMNKISQNSEQLVTELKNGTQILGNINFPHE